MLDFCGIGISHLVKLHTSIQRDDTGKIDLLITMDQFSQNDAETNGYTLPQFRNDMKTFSLSGQTFQKVRYNQCSHFMTCSIRGVKLDSRKRYKAILYHNLKELYTMNTTDRVPALKSLKNHPPHRASHVDLLRSLLTSSDFRLIGFYNEQQSYCELIQSDEIDDNISEVRDAQIKSPTIMNHNQTITHSKFRIVNHTDINEYLQWLSTQKRIRLRLYYILHHMIRWLHVKGESEAASWLYWESVELQPKQSSEDEYRTAFQKSILVQILIDKDIVVPTPTTTTS